MKKYVLKCTLIIFTSLIFNNCQRNNNMEKINVIIENVAKKYAPDKRVAIFNITPEIIGRNVTLKGETNIHETIDEIMKEIKLLEYSIKNEIELLPHNELGENTYGIVNLSVANIRTNPRHPAELATQSLLGTCVNVLKKKGGWYLVQTPDKYISWVDGDGIKVVNENEQKSWKNSEKVIITSQFSNAFKYSDVNSPKISDLVEGNILKKIKKGAKFIQIQFPDGREGYVLKNHTMDYEKWINSVYANSTTIINSAFNFMGLPYLWGGTSSKGFDCSGFTKTVYFLSGVILPRDASQQVNVGEIVNTAQNFNQLLPGDLLFFGFKGNSGKKERITHVGIYVGNNEFIHSAGRVRINSFDETAENFNAFRLKTFIRAKRIIGNYNTGENLVAQNNFYN